MNKTENVSFRLWFEYFDVSSTFQVVENPFFDLYSKEFGFRIVQDISNISSFQRGFYSNMKERSKFFLRMRKLTPFANLSIDTVLRNSLYLRNVDRDLEKFSDAVLKWAANFSQRLSLNSVTEKWNSERFRKYISSTRELTLDVNTRVTKMEEPNSILSNSSKLSELSKIVPKVSKIESNFLNYNRQYNREVSQRMEGTDMFRRELSRYYFPNCESLNLGNESFYRLPNLKGVSSILAETHDLTVCPFLEVIYLREVRQGEISKLRNLRHLRVLSVRLGPGNPAYD